MAEQATVIIDEKLTTAKVRLGSWTGPGRMLDGTEREYLAGVADGRWPRDDERDYAIARRCLPAPETIPGEKTASWWELK